MSTTHTHDELTYACLLLSKRTQVTNCVQNKYRELPKSLALLLTTASVCCVPMESDAVPLCV